MLFLKHSETLNVYEIYFTFSALNTSDKCGFQEWIMDMNDIINFLTSVVVCMKS